MTRAWSACLLALVLAGCALTGVEEVSYYEPAQAIEVARAKADRGEWSQALQVLDAHLVRFPGHPDLTRMRQLLDGELQQHRQNWEDRLLILRARELLNRIPVLEEMNNAEPLRLQVRWDLGQDRDELEALRPKLLACGQRQLDRYLYLASSCARLADRTRSDPSSRRLADRIALRSAGAEGEQLGKALRARDSEAQRAKRKSKAASGKAASSDKARARPDAKPKKAKRRQAKRAKPSPAAPTNENPDAKSKATAAGGSVGAQAANGGNPGSEAAGPQTAAQRPEAEQPGITLSVLEPIEPPTDSQSGQGTGPSPAERARNEARIERKLTRAAQRLSESAYAEAALLIDQVLAVDPRHQRARQLQRQLDRTLAHQRRLLDDLASRYYTDGDIDAAIQVWETLLRLSAGEIDVEDRLERARKVKEKLDAVKAADQATN